MNCRCCLIPKDPIDLDELNQIIAMKEELAMDYQKTEKQEMANAALLETTMAEMQGVPLREKLARISELINKANMTLVSIARPHGFRIGDDEPIPEPPDVIGQIEADLDGLQEQAETLVDLVMRLHKRL